jgi:hypothetical protein
VAILFTVSRDSNQSKAPDTPVIKKEKKNGYFMLFICNLEIYIYISYNLRSYKKKREATKKSCEGREWEYKAFGVGLRSSAIACPYCLQFGHAIVRAILRYLNVIIIILSIENIFRSDSILCSSKHSKIRKTFSRRWLLGWFAIRLGDGWEFWGGGFGYSRCHGGGVPVFCAPEV